jgi:hypothetical protein
MQAIFGFQTFPKFARLKLTSELPLAVATD